MTNALSAAEEAFLIEGLEDWIGLWRFVRDARDERPSATADEIRELVMPTVRKLVAGGYIRPGRLTDERPGFTEWQEGADEAVERIDSEWRALGRDPNIPDICWFTNTELGNRVARKILSRDA